MIGLGYASCTTLNAQCQEGAGGVAQVGVIGITGLASSRSGLPASLEQP